MLDRHSISYAEDIAVKMADIISSVFIEDLRRHIFAVFTNTIRDSPNETVDERSYRNAKFKTLEQWYNSPRPLSRGNHLVGLALSQAPTEVDKVTLPFLPDTVQYHTIASILAEATVKAKSTCIFFVPKGHLRVAMAAVKSTAMHRLSADTHSIERLLATALQASIHGKGVFILPWVNPEVRGAVVDPNCWVKLAGSQRRKRPDADSMDDLMPVEKQLKRASDWVSSLETSDETAPWNVTTAPQLLSRHQAFLSRRDPPSDLAKLFGAQTAFQNAVAQEFLMEKPSHRIGLYYAIIISSILPTIRLPIPSTARQISLTGRAAIAAYMKGSSMAFEMPSKDKKGVKDIQSWIEVFVLGWLFYLGCRDGRWTATTRNPDWKAMKHKLGATLLLLTQ